jgi:N utilization substance protein B
MKSRTLGRELAFKYLYSLDIADKVVADNWLEFAQDQEPASAEARMFGLDLVNGILRVRPDLIQLIEGSAKNWVWRRMPIVDRTVLLAGAFELAFKKDDVPPSVAIDEWVDVAKRFGSQASGSFVNGVLDGLRKKLENS